MTLQGEELLDALERGEVRAAEPDGAGGWVVHAWVKEAILDVFRESEIVEQGLEATEGARMFRDKAALPVRRFTADDGVRVVPGGSAIRRGSYVGKGVVCMPPMYINVGAYVGEGTMVDSHALVGTCAQVGSGVHVSAACQVGGVLEPAGARPVIVEDGAFLGGNTGLYEGVLVGAGAVLASGVVLTATTPLFDLVSETQLTGTPDEPLQVPAGAVVVPGVRALDSEFARAQGLSAACAVIVKYRDEGTDARTALEDALR
ncbi:MAG: 2,3,4,5-tetrahydropyridine-2,6-dicarboxylate N-succinyltransferase [Planctomycetes bacterium]|nr:2,3,4,5-tetrahydropyridine-2,6-dicarboxylate N-succinyltransferase [Planctomycetota bacterium]